MVLSYLGNWCTPPSVCINRLRKIKLPSIFETFIIIALQQSLEARSKLRCKPAASSLTLKRVPVLIIIALWPLDSKSNCVPDNWTQEVGPDKGPSALPKVGPQSSTHGQCTGFLQEASSIRGSNRSGTWIRTRWACGGQARSQTRREVYGNALVFSQAKTLSEKISGQQTNQNYTSNSWDLGHRDGSKLAEWGRAGNVSNLPFISLPLLPF